ADKAPDPAALRPHAGGREPVERHTLAEIRERMRRVMSARVAIVRRDEGLALAAEELAELQRELAPRVANGAPTVELASLWQALRLARLTVASARRRRESRGLHYNADCPGHGAGRPQPSRIHLAELAAP
ncbi:MAG: L-aspartate oxidase, partial [Halomonas sp. BM-2019]